MQGSFESIQGSFESIQGSFESIQGSLRYIAGLVYRALLIVYRALFRNLRRIGAPDSCWFIKRALYSSRRVVQCIQKLVDTLHNSPGSWRLASRWTTRSFYVQSRLNFKKSPVFFEKSPVKYLKSGAYDFHVVKGFGMHSAAGGEVKFVLLKLAF